MADSGQKSEEWVDLVDAGNRVVGKTTRREVRRRNLLHRGVGIICFNSKGEVYVHRRTETKDVFPGMYDMFVGGVVESGEDYRTAAVRELAEELGIDGVELQYLFPHLYKGPKNHSWIQVYEVLWDGAIVHQETEIDWGAWIAEENLNAWVEQHPIVPDGLDVYDHYRDWSKSGRPTREQLP